MNLSTAAAIRTALACGNPRCACVRGRNTHCPAHRDRHPSLAVDERDGRVLVRCRVACSQAEVLAALRARGLWSTASTRRPPPERSIHGIALDRARAQPWTRPGVLEGYRAADAFRLAMRNVHGARAAATKAGDTPAAWALLAAAARVEVNAHAIEAECDATLRLAALP